MGFIKSIAIVKKHWKKITILLLVAGGGYVLLFFKKTETPTTTTVREESVVRDDLVVTVSGSGQVQAFSQVDLKPVIAGDGINVIDVRVRNNQTVKKNQVIAVLDTEEAFRDIENARLDVRSAELKQKQISDQYDRNVKEDRLQRQTQEVVVEQRKNALRKTQEALQDYYIKAPFDGIVTGLSVEAGDSISRDAVLASVITQDMRADIILNEVDAAKVAESASVKLSFDALPELSLSGRISRINTIGEVTQNVVSYGAEISFDEQNASLRPGMSVSADIVVSKRQGVLLVPNAALSVSNGKTTVNTKTGTKRVTVGITDNVRTEILDGLQEGDRVLIETAAVAPTSGSASLFSSFFRSGQRNR